MGFVEEMKWWHWVAVSLLIGFGLAFLNGMNNGTPGGSEDAITQEQFEFDLQRTFPHNGTTYPMISNIKVFPPVTKVDPKGNTFVTQVVTFTRMRLAKEGGDNSTHDTVLYAPIPYAPEPMLRIRRGNPIGAEGYPGLATYIGKPQDTLMSVANTEWGRSATEADLTTRILAIRASNPQHFANAHSSRDLVIIPGQVYFIPRDPISKPTVVDFLSDAKAAKWPVNFKYAWWTDPHRVYYIWVGGSFLIIGVIFPLVIRIMLHEGYGRAPAEEEQKGPGRSQEVDVPGRSGSADGAGSRTGSEFEGNRDHQRRRLGSDDNGSGADRQAGSGPAQGDGDGESFAGKKEL
jgi:hypothetical protein